MQNDHAVDGMLDDLDEDDELMPMPKEHREYESQRHARSRKVVCAATLLVLFVIVVLMEAKAFPPTVVRQSSSPPPLPEAFALRARYKKHPTLQTMPAHRAIENYEDMPLETDILLSASPAERFMLMGPFETQPSEWMTTFIAPDVLAHLGVINYVTSFAAEAVDASVHPATMLPYPPIHVHHVHVGRAERARGVMQQHWLEAHGDYAPDYSTMTPASFCRVLGSGASLSIFAQLVDARKPPRISDVAASAALAEPSVVPALKWWLRLRFGISTRPCVPIGKLVIWFPLTSDATRDTLIRYDVGNTERLQWWTVELSASGRVVPPVWVHAHRARYSGLLLLRGAQTPLDIGGLEQDSCARTRPECTSVAALRAFLLARVDPATLLCHDNASAANFELVPTDDGGLGHYDRRGQLLCAGGFEFQKRERLTVFGFTRAVWDADVAHFPMHTLVLAHYTPLITTHAGAGGNTTVDAMVGGPSAFAAQTVAASPVPAVREGGLYGGTTARLSETEAEAEADLGPVMYAQPRGTFGRWDLTHGESEQIQALPFPPDA